MSSFSAEISSPVLELPQIQNEVARERVAADVEAFVRARFSVPRSDLLFTRTVDLFEEGYVDSTGLVELIAHVEELYGIRLPEEALFDTSFGNIDGIARVVAELLAP